MSAPRGAGRGGGLLFALVLAFTAALAWQSLGGTLRLPVVGGVAALLVVVLASTVHRR